MARGTGDRGVETRMFDSWRAQSERPATYTALPLFNPRWFLHTFSTSEHPLLQEVISITGGHGGMDAIHPGASSGT